MEIKDIEKLAELAKIELNDEEKAKLLKDLDSILGYVKQIQEVDVKDVAVEYENRNIWREDKLEERDFSKEIIAEQFPDAQDGFVKVKKIM
jgi:aspartyl-tRNA(Asn)/glutamyl-tRNA(Gln) amidotransferase subunit C